MTSIYKSRMSWTSLSKYQNKWTTGEMKYNVCLLQENEISYSTQSCTFMFNVKNNHQASQASSFANTSQKQKSRINRGPTSILQQPLLLATDWPPDWLFNQPQTHFSLSLSVCVWLTSCLLWYLYLHPITAVTFRLSCPTQARWASTST